MTAATRAFYQAWRAGTPEIIPQPWAEAIGYRRQQEAPIALELGRDVLLEPYAAIVPEALDNLIPEERRRLYKLLRITVIVQPDTTLEVGRVFGEGLSVSNHGLVSGLQEDLTRNLVRAPPAGMILGEPPGPAPQERRHPGDLLQCPVRPLDGGLACGLRLFPAEDVVQGVGEDARAGVAHERALDEVSACGGVTEGKEGYFEGFGHALFQVGADDQVRLRGFDAGRDRFWIFLDESPFGEGVRVEEEVPLEVREVGAADDDLQSDLAGEGVAEAQRVGEVPEDGDPAVLEGLRRFEACVPGEFRRTGELGPDRTLHGLGVELAQLADGPQGGAR